MARTNWLKNFYDAIWAPIVEDAVCIDIFGQKWLKRQLTNNDLEAERAPFLAAWITTPEPQWWAAKATRVSCEIDFIGVVVTGDIQDQEIPTGAYVNIVGALEEDFLLPNGYLRSVGRVITFEYTNPAILYGRDTKQDAGVYFLNFGVKAEIQNPNS